MMKAYSHFSVLNPTTCPEQAAWTRHLRTFRG